MGVTGLLFVVFMDRSIHSQKLRGIQYKGLVVTSVLFADVVYLVPSKPDL